MKKSKENKTQQAKFGRNPVVQMVKTLFSDSLLR